MASKYKESYVTFGQVWPRDPKQTKNGSHARSTTTTTTTTTTTVPPSTRLSTAVTTTTATATTTTTRWIWDDGWATTRGATGWAMDKVRPHPFSFLKITINTHNPATTSTLITTTTAAVRADEVSPPNHFLKKLYFLF